MTFPDVSCVGRCVVGDCVFVGDGGKGESVGVGDRAPYLLLSAGVSSGSGFVMASEYVGEEGTWFDIRMFWRVAIALALALFAAWHVSYPVLGLQMKIAR